MRLTVLGSGAWGTALACALAPRHPVTLWGRNEAQVTLLQRERCNERYLPGVPLPAALGLSSNLGAALEATELAILAIPVAGLRTTLEELYRLRPELSFLWACKGFERHTDALPHQVVASLYPEFSRVCWGALSGPSFAQEVASGKPAALTLASTAPHFARKVLEELHAPRLRLYSSIDLVGVELAGALKNVIAIASGLCDGLDLGLNARAALITRGLTEIARLGVALGGQPETFMGLSGLGDLILTCTGALSRNYQVGRQLAKGRPLPQILAELGHVAEGVSSADSALRLCKRHSVEMPITQAVAKVLEGQATALQALDELLAREPRSEGLLAPTKPH